MLRAAPGANQRLVVDYSIRLLLLHHLVGLQPCAARCTAVFLPLPNLPLPLDDTNVFLPLDSFRAGLLPLLAPAAAPFRCMFFVLRVRLPFCQAYSLATPSTPRCCRRIGSLDTDRVAVCHASVPLCFCRNSAF